MCAHVSGIRDDPNPPEIETVRVPTSPDARIRVVGKIGVPGAGEIEQLKLLIAYLKALSP